MVLLCVGIGLAVRNLDISASLQTPDWLFALRNVHISNKRARGGRADEKYSTKHTSAHRLPPDKQSAACVHKSLAKLEELRIKTHDFRKFYRYSYTKCAGLLKVIKMHITFLREKLAASNALAVPRRHRRRHRHTIVPPGQAAVLSPATQCSHCWAPEL